MATTMKRTEGFTWAVDENARTITTSGYRMDADGKRVYDPALTATLRLDDVSEANRAYAVYHGLKQRWADCGALKSGATLAEKFATMEKTRGHLASGAEAWDLPGTGKRVARELTADEKRALIAKWTAELGTELPE